MKILLATLFFSLYGSVQIHSQSIRNWHHKDPKKDKLCGISTARAYELLKGRESQTVIVAVIDGGIDTSHIDLKGKLWVNPGEIPGNGIDDDNNGYIDDINGWNFIGNSKGENIHYETLELTREYKKLSKKYRNNNDTSKFTLAEKNQYEYYRKVRNDYLHRFKKAKDEYEGFNRFSETFAASCQVIKTYLKKDTFNLDDLNTLRDNFFQEVRNSASFLFSLMSKDFDIESFEAYREQATIEYLYQLKLDYNPRTIVGDDPENSSDSIYGNNDVMGPSSGHGTFVAGIIAAIRNNDNEADGIADNVKIMAVRIVPDGDERDKDVALAIKYAADNGAKIINMSFGKDYSPQKSLVDKAVKYAANRNVLMIHAAGNEATNNDLVWHYPVNISTDSGKVLTDLWIEVGASGPKKGRFLAAEFSNFGKKSVDVFAPGTKVYSLNNNNGYSAANGTSAASPVVSGIAALLMSYFPELEPAAVRKIIFDTSVRVRRKTFVPDEANPDTFKRHFTELSVTGGVANACNAVKKAIEITGLK